MNPLTDQELAERRTEIQEAEGGFALRESIASLLLDIAGLASNLVTSQTTTNTQIGDGNGSLTAVNTAIRTGNSTLVEIHKAVGAGNSALTTLHSSVGNSNHALTAIHKATDFSAGVLNEIHTHLQRLNGFAELLVERQTETLGTILLLLEEMKLQRGDRESPVATTGDPPTRRGKT